MSKDTFAPPEQYRAAKKTIEDTQKRLYQQAEKAVNSMTKSDKFCLSCHCVHGGTCPPHEARATGVAGLQESFRAACEEIVRLKDHLVMVESWLDAKQNSIDHHITEIENLRNALDYAHKRCVLLAEERDKERRLKDEARQGYCELEMMKRLNETGGARYYTKRDIAKERDWGYLYEKDPSLRILKPGEKYNAGLYVANQDEKEKSDE